VAGVAQVADVEVADGPVEQIIERITDLETKLALLNIEIFSEPFLRVPTVLIIPVWNGYACGWRRHRFA